MTRLDWRSASWDVAYGFTAEVDPPVAVINSDRSIWVSGVGEVTLPKGTVLVDRQRKAIAELVYLHLQGEIDLEEIQR